ncbi:MAG: NAD-dependent epimerase/dehydratase family protein [Pseudomonadota bacterium]
MSHSPSPSSVLILGARGRFGSAAVHAFAQAGWQVHAQMRPGATPPPAAPGVQWLLADPDDTAALAAAAKGAAVVVQGLSPLYTHKVWRTEVPRLTNAAIAITRELRTTLMLPASVYNFGEGMPARLLEDTPQNATTFMGRMRIASEALVREATLDGGMKAVVIRGGNFFGSGSGSWLDLVMAKDIQKGRLSYPGAANVPVSWAYLPDMARSFVDVANRREALPGFEALHFAGHTLTQQDWVDALDEIAWERGWLPESGRLQVKAMSWPLLRALGLFMPTLAAICEMRYLWRVPHGLVNRRMAALAGPEAHTPFEKALRTSLDELGMVQGRASRPAADLARA